MLNLPAIIPDKEETPLLKNLLTDCIYLFKYDLNALSIKY